MAPPPRQALAQLEREHAELADRLDAFAGEVFDAARSADLLARWYREHVIHSDRPLLDWLASRA